MLRGAIEETMDKGKEHLNKLLRPRPAGVYLSVGEAAPGQASTGHYRRSVHSEMKTDTLGVLDDSKVVYGPWLEGTGSRNTATRFKGYSSFRRTEQHLQSQVGGILAGHVGKLVRELNGGI